MFLYLSFTTLFIVTWQKQKKKKKLQNQGEIPHAFYPHLLSNKLL